MSHFLRRHRDGNSGVFSAIHGETYNTPVEITEARNGLFVDCMEFSGEPGGEGEFTGGRGMRLDYRIRRDNSFLTMGWTRSRILPWSLDGGKEGSPNYALVLRKDGSSERFAFASGIRLNKDDVIRLTTGAGGEFGDPRKRDPQKVREDVRNGFLSPKRASEIYGVEI